MCYISIQNLNNGDAILTGHTSAKASKGPVDKANNHCQPNVGIIIKAKNTSKHAPNAQKH